jgi:prepilin-type processing-associated H-X9-DG protein
LLPGQPVSPTRKVAIIVAGLTRIELLILLFIGGILTAIGVPWVESAREAARRNSCKYNFKQVGLALENYHDVFHSFPYGCVGNLKMVPSRRWSWFIGIKPYLGSQPELPFDLTKASDDTQNIPVRFEADDKGGRLREYELQPPLAIHCPNGETQTDALGQPLATYVGMAGLGRDTPTLPLTNPRAGMWGYDRVTTLDDVKGPHDAVIHVIETAADRGSWYRGGPATVRGFVPGDKPAIGKNGQFGGFHPGVAMTLFVDGHVEPLSEDIDEAVFSGMATIAGKK